jgi:hypothetical protein
MLNAELDRTQRAHESAEERAYREQCEQLSLTTSVVTAMLTPENTREFQIGETVRIPLPWRARHINAAEQLRRKATWGGFTANVIEGEEL